MTTSSDLTPGRGSVSVYRSIPDHEDGSASAAESPVDLAVGTGSPQVIHEQNTPQVSEQSQPQSQPQPQPVATGTEDLYSSLMEAKKESVSTRGSCGGFFAKLFLYIHHAFREAGKRKCQYFLAFFSVFLVVFVAGTALSVSTRAPAIFLNQAEKNSGQIDFVLSSRGEGFKYLNFKQIAEVGEKHPEVSLTSPRYYSQYQGTVYHKRCVTHADEKGIDTSIDAPNDWMYRGSLALGAVCTETSYDSCLSQICPENPSLRASFRLSLIDSEREQNIGVGREWKYGPIPPGHAIISSRLADEMGYREGDVAFLTLDDFNNVEETFSYNSGHIQKTLIAETLRSHIPEVEFNTNVNVNTTQILQSAINSFAAYSDMPIKIHKILDNSHGKYPEEDMRSYVIMEMDSYLEYYASKMNPSLASKDLDYLSSISTPQHLTDDCPVKILPWSVSDLIALAGQKKIMNQFSSEVVANIYGDRISPYLKSSYEDILQVVAKEGTKFTYLLGYTDIRADAVLLDEVEPLKMFSMFLDLILSIVLTILFVLSFMLIYALLTISVETRTFELGIHRMTGIKRRGIIEMLFVQAFSYSIPGVIIGLIAAQLVTSAVIYMFESSLKIPLSSNLTTVSVIVAIVLGLLLPIVASIFPIQSALSQNLHDVLDSEHSKQVGVEFTIERSEDNAGSFALLVVGLGMTIFGFCIYYLLPLSLLSMNLALFFNIFFAILLGILFGLVLLSFNVQHLVERVVVYCFLFWEKSFIPEIVLKNLVAHKVRNRKTSMMYAISLGFILFIIMALTTELKNSSAVKAKEYGSDIALIIGRSNSGVKYNGEFELESTLINSPVAHIVKEWAWASQDLATLGGEAVVKPVPVYTDFRMTNVGRTHESELKVVAVSPSFSDASFEKFYTQNDGDYNTQLSPTEQLYTLRGSQSALYSTSLADYYAVKGATKDQRATLMNAQDRYNSTLLSYRSNAIAIVDSFAGLDMTKFKTSSAQSVITSFPALMALSGGKYDDTGALPLGKLLIRLHDNVKPKDKAQLLASIRSTVRILQLGGANMTIKQEKSDNSKSTENVIILIFSFAAFLCMFLCMFSLIASMYSNIYESAREIGVLRAVGLTASQVTRIYIYEAFALVFASSLLGILIGGFIGWSIMLFRVLFTQLPLTFDFPWTTLVAVLVAAVVCSFISAWSPIRALNKKSISGIFKTFY